VSLSVFVCMCFCVGFELPEVDECGHFPSERRVYGGSVGCINELLLNSQVKF
jgi:hypothetical protein